MLILENLMFPVSTLDSVDYEEKLYEAGIFVSVVNALRIHNYCGESIRRAKTDKIDSVKIANLIAPI